MFSSLEMNGKSAAECSGIAKKNKSFLQQQTELKGSIDELWKLMQIPKKSYNRVKQEYHCKVEWRVKNDEGKDSGVQQHKVWKPGRLQLARNNDSKAFQRLQTKVWDPGRQKLEMHDQEVMILFYFWSLMQEHQLSRPATKFLIRP